MTLSKKYNMIMEEINVTPDMRLRILENIANQANTKHTYKTDLSGKIIHLNGDKADTRHFRLNRSTVNIIAAAACAVLCILGIYGIYSHNISNAPKPSTPSQNVAVLPDDKSTESDSKNSSGKNQTDTASNSSVTSADNQPNEGNVTSGNQPEQSYSETPTGYPSGEYDTPSDTNGAVPGENTDNTITASENTEPSTEGELTMIASPFIDCNSIDEAAAITGFGMTVPDSVNGNEIDHISTISRDTIQVIYGAGYDNSTYIRKAEGSDDISGDYNTYRQKKQITVNGASVTLKGNNGKINLATWSSNGYSYSISAVKGFDESYITDLISIIE